MINKVLILDIADKQLVQADDDAVLEKLNVSINLKSYYFSDEEKT
jgi:hypothetical protein